MEIPSLELLDQSNPRVWCSMSGVRRECSNSVYVNLNQVRDPGTLVRWSINLGHSCNTARFTDAMYIPRMGLPNDYGDSLTATP